MTDCRDCEHCEINTRHDVYPATEEFWCQHPDVKEDWKGNWIGYLPNTPDWCPLETETEET